MYVCRRLYAVRGRPSRSNLRFSSSRMVLKSSRCHFGKMRSVGCGRAPFFGAGQHGVPRTFLWAPARHKRAPGGAGLRSPLEGTHSTAHALAIADPALSAHFDLQDRLTAGLVVNDGDVPELKSPRFVGPQAGIGREQHIIVKLFRFPFEARLLRLMRALSCRFVELFVFLGGEPRPVRDFRG
jgi:hypothetical protein